MVSLLFLVMSLIAWPLSHLYAFSLTHHPVRVSFVHGSFVIECSPTWVAPEVSTLDLHLLSGPRDRYLLLHEILSEHEFEFPGINFYRTPDLASAFGSNLVSLPTQNNDGWTLDISLAYLAALSAILPLFWLAFLRRTSKRFRKANGLCVHCGYDLRGSSDDHADCPECGLSSVA